MRLPKGRRCPAPAHLRSHRRCPLPPQIYESGLPSKAAAKQGAQPVVDDSQSTAVVVQYAQQLRGVAPS